MNVSAESAGWTIALIFVLALYGLLLWRLWKPREGSGPSLEAPNLAAPPPEAQGESSPLGVAMDGANFFIPTQAPGKVGIAIRTRVWNSGDPIYVTDWKLRISPAGGAEVAAHASAIPEKLTFVGYPPETAIREEQSLVRKLNAEAVGARPLEGILLFYADSNLEAVNSPETMLELTLTDSLNRRATFSHQVGDWLRA